MASQKLQIPEVPLTLNNQLHPQWRLFFERVCKLIRVSDMIEYATGQAEVNGNYRTIQSGNNLVTQRRESGAWVTKHTITP